MCVLQIVAHAVDFTVALDLALRPLEFDGTVRSDGRVSGVDQRQASVDGIGWQIKPVDDF